MYKQVDSSSVVSDGGGAPQNFKKSLVHESPHLKAWLAFLLTAVLVALAANLSKGDDICMFI